MSTFCGIMEEFPTLRVDRFDNDYKNAEAFFLSHCHTDHMIGLNDPDFRNELRDNKKLLYASPISCTILKSKFPDLTSQITEIELNWPLMISLKQQSFSVTSMPAGHCPGSIMFLFEMDSCSVLYTGDYRINSRDIKKFKPFYEASGKVKVIEKIYLDTTFFLKSYLKFPTREMSLEKLVALIDEWIVRSKEHKVILVTSAKYGSEYVFKEIYEKCNMPVLVNHEIFEFCSLIPELDKAVTTDCSITQIDWAYCKQYRGSYDEEKQQVRIIKTSALTWQQEDLNNGICRNDDGRYAVCYSTHASFEEGMALLDFLKPKKIHPCVDQRKPSDQIEMLKLIEESLSHRKENHQETNNNPHLFEVDDMEDPQKFEEKTLSSDITEPLNKIRKVCDIFDSPPR